LAYFEPTVAGAKAGGFVAENRINTFAMIDANWKLIYRTKRKEAGLDRELRSSIVLPIARDEECYRYHPADVERMMTEIDKIGGKQ
jgi:hypothetical protein